MNHKRVYRLYRQKGIAVQLRKRKRIKTADRQTLTIPTQPNERCSMDFVADVLNDGATGTGTSRRLQFMLRLEF